jgi:hypothetical protein
MCIWKVSRVFTSSLHKDEKVNERQGNHVWTLHQQIMCLNHFICSLPVNTFVVMVLCHTDYRNEPYELLRYAYPSQ